VESIAVTDETNVTVAIAAEADRHDACAVVVGSRGLGCVKAPLLGSTTQGLLRRTGFPVMVVRAAQ
jgi:nucleotide-binding universal stress UspA family protein